MDDPLTQAVQAARYNEAVVVQVAEAEAEAEEATTGTREVVLVATLDAAQGGVTWQSAASRPTSLSLHGDDDVGIRRHVRTKKWLLPMLNDRVRNTLYQRAIQQACHTVVGRLFTHDAETTAGEPVTDDTLQILDIGSGTGLLAMMASTYARQALRAAATNGDTTTTNRPTTSATTTNVHVRSLEMASAMARLARHTVAANGFTKEEIHIQEAHSCEVLLCADDSRFRLCTSELLEAGLLGEGILPALRDAWERHLHPAAIVVPQRARVYAQLVEANEWLAAYAGPSSQEIDFGTGGLRLTTGAADDATLLGGVPGVLVPIHVECLVREDRPCHTCMLSEPTMVMDFDFTSAAAMPGPEGRARRHTIVPTATGTAQAVLFWWQLDLGDGLTYSTECGQQPWQDHWPQCLYIFTDSTQLVTVHAGEAVCLTCHHTDTRLSFSLQARPNEGPSKRLKGGAAPELPLSAFRATILADTSRIFTMQHAIASALATLGTGALVLDVSDFSLCAVLAALSGASHVVSLESSSCGPALAMLSARMAQLGNQLPRDGSVFEILQCHAEQLASEALGNTATPARLVVAEPYYEILEGWHLQEAINYFFLLQSFQRRGLLSAEHVSLPSYARIMGCAIQSDALYNAYSGCGGDTDTGNQTKDSSAVCGVDHGIVNHFAARYHEYDLSLPMWQYEYTKLTDAFEIGKLDYNQLKIEGNGEWREVPFGLRSSGTCHGLLLWIDYGYASETKERMSEAMISTKACPYNQVVRLLETPISGVNQESVFRCRLSIGGDQMVDNEIHSIELDIVETK